MSQPGCLLYLPSLPLPLFSWGLLSFFVDLAHTGSPPSRVIFLLPAHCAIWNVELVGEDHNDNDNDDDDEDISDHPFCVLFSVSLAAIYSSII